MIAEDLAFSLPYTNNYFSPLSPAMLGFVPRLHRVHAGPAGGRFNYAEFGCGQGMSLLVMAATNPEATFYGIDYSPAHIARARRMADAAGLTNVVLLERAFEELTPADLPPVDIAVMHGIYSWIARDTRDALVRVIDRHLQPGGLVYVSYNTTASWPQLLPVQRLLNDYAEQASGPAKERARRAFDFLETLIATSAGHFGKDAKGLAAWLKQVRSGDMRYVLHEYFARNWEPMPHSQVAREMAGAKLTYVGTTDVVDTVDRFTLGAEPAKLLAGMADGPLKETTRDLLRNRSFRRDVFARGPMAMTAGEAQDALNRQRLTLLRPRERCALGVKFPVGTVELNPQAFTPVLDRLARGPATLAELAAAMGETKDQNALRRAVTMVAAGFAFPCPPADADPAPAQRLNRVLADEVALGHEHKVVASPVLGAGVGLQPAQLAMLAGDAPLPEAGSPALAAFETDRAFLEMLGVGFAPSAKASRVPERAAIA